MKEQLASLGERTIPNKFRPRLKTYLHKTGHLIAPYHLFGLMFLLAIVFDFVWMGFLFSKLYSIYGILFVLVSLPLFFVSLVLITILFYVFSFVYFEIIIFRRTATIERVLPDFLKGVSVNLRAGMTFDKAIWNAVQPEYGVLEKEIEIVAKKVMTGEDIEQALKEFAGKYNSQVLKESVDLIVIGLKSGGEISDLIDRVVDNVKEIAFLKQELIANVMSYVIFISIIAVAIAPSLFALSYNLLIIMQNLGAKLTSSGSSVIPFEFGSQTIQPEQFITYSKWSIGVIAAASSMIIADLREGSIKGGIKYMIFFVIGGLIVYNLMLGVFTGIFGGMVA